MHLVDTNASIYVAGHRGLVGSAIIDELRRQGFDNLILRTSAELDLRDQSAVDAFFSTHAPHFVILAAAQVGGILANDSRPAEFIADNLSIQTNVIRAAHEADVQRLIFLGSSCIYPREAPQPLREEYLLTGPLEPTNQWYAVAKIAGLKMCEAYRRQHGSDFLTLMPTNVYGPGDNMDPQSSHVLGALLRKFHEAKHADQSNPVVTVWGSGTPRREFIYSRDLAEAVVFILKKPAEQLYQVAPDGMLNVGVAADMTIMELAERIREAVGLNCTIELDRSKPDGTPRKLMDTSRLAQLGWQPTTRFEDGLREMYEWYRQDAVLS